MEEERPQERTYSVGYKLAELKQELGDLEDDEDVKLFVRVSRGQRKYEKYKQFALLLEKASKPQE